MREGVSPPPLPGSYGPVACGYHTDGSPVNWNLSVNKTKSGSLPAWRQLGNIGYADKNIYLVGNLLSFKQFGSWTVIFVLGERVDPGQN